jgi:hypothetical protein
LVGIFGRGISPSQGRYLHTEWTHTDIHASSGIPTHDPSVRAGEDGSCIRQRGHCDRLVFFNRRFENKRYFNLIYFILLNRKQLLLYMSSPFLFCSVFSQWQNTPLLGTDHSLITSTPLPPAKFLGLPDRLMRKRLRSLGVGR